VTQKKTVIVEAAIDFNFEITLLPVSPVRIILKHINQNIRINQHQDAFPMASHIAHSRWPAQPQISVSSWA